MLNVPETDDDVHPRKGTVPQCIYEGWKQSMELLTDEGYRHSDPPDFEHYLEGDLNSPDYRVELWIPFKKIA
ncbi:MAG: GyrI-like domain-containing protein [Anaerolineaceae bacterium]